MVGLTLPETNIAPENRPLEKEIPTLETTILKGAKMWILGSVKLFWEWEFLPNLKKREKKFGLFFLKEQTQQVKRPWEPKNIQPLFG